LFCIYHLVSVNIFIFNTPKISILGDICKFYFRYLGINIIIYEKSKFIIDEFNILGYSEVKGQIVLVLGEWLGDKIQILNDKRKFAFRRKELWKNKSVPPPPPSMYNPQNYIFLYE
jgi:hypothetical protein